MECFISGCIESVKKMGFCEPHFRQWQIHRNRALYGGLTTSERFCAKVDKSGECWIWTGGKQRGGYGSFSYRTGTGRVGIGAHRWAWEEVNGPIPEGLVLDHLCRVRLCVRPAHLEPVTNHENILRGMAAARAAGARRLGRPARQCSHPEERKRVRPNKNGFRNICLDCDRERSARRKANGALVDVPVMTV